MNRDLGRLGESIVAQWAAQVGLILNRSGDHDAAGWDFLLEWPHPARDGVLNPALDRVAAPVQCLMQVKSTTRSIRRLPIKLSNWDRLVKTTLPAFFLVLHFTEHECTDAFLIPVGEEEIRATLRREREISTEKQHRGLHQHTLGLKWSDSHRLATRDGAGLRRALLDHAQSTNEQYASWKMELINSAGYETGTGELTVRVKRSEEWPADPQRTLVDFTLGLIPHFELDGAEFKDVRFGIESPLPDFVLAPGSLMMVVDQGPDSTGELKIRAPGLKKQIRIPIGVTFPRGLDGIIEPEYLRCRCTAPFVDFCIAFTAPQELDFTIQFPASDEHHALNELRPATSIILLLEAARHSGENLEFEVMIDQKRAGGGTINACQIPNQTILGWANLVEQAWVVARSFEIESLVTITARDLFTRKDGLFLLHSILSPEPAFVSATFWIAGSEWDPNSLWCIPIAKELTLGGFVVQLAFAVVGPAIATGQIDGDSREFRLETRDVRVHAKDVYPRNSAGHSDQDALITEVTKIYEDTMNVVQIS